MSQTTRRAELLRKLQEKLPDHPFGVASVLAIRMLSGCSEETYLDTLEACVLNLIELHESLFNQYMDYIQLDVRPMFVHKKDLLPPQ